MAKKIEKWISDDGEEFNTENEADLQDLKHQLDKVFEEEASYGNIAYCDIVDILLKNDQLVLKLVQLNQLVSE